jgi:hypothetical protein
MIWVFGWILKHTARCPDSEGSADRKRNCKEEKERVTLFARALMTIRTRPVTIRTRPHLAIQKRGGDLRARDCLFTRSNCNAAYCWNKPLDHKR